MSSCYLTIDDSPSPYTDKMIDYLVQNNIPAILFVRGHLLANDPAPIIRAIKHGFIIGNHSYAHRPFGALSYEESVTDIEKCEALIDQAYKDAGVTREGKYFRFPYLDRGDGNRIERHFESVTDMDMDINADARVQKLQHYLLGAGYTQPFQTTHPIYQNPSIADAADCLMTYTSFDWMMTKRHAGKYNYKTIGDLKRRIDDANIHDYDGNILIFHDDRDDILSTFKSLIDYMIFKGYKFLSSSEHNNKEVNS
jgi:peptidoglycan/xylan/chitin deacetylase (PgdA/CDA1 family)